MITEKRIKELMKGIEGVEKRSRASVINELMRKYKLSESSARVYYTTWRHMFMKEGLEPKAEPKAEIKEDVKAILKNAKAIEVKPLKGDKIEAGTIDKSLLGAKPLLNMQGFIPKTFKGKYFTYKVGKDKLEIEDGQVTSVSKECIEEQTRALKLWEEIKCILK